MIRKIELSFRWERGICTLEFIANEQKLFAQKLEMHGKIKSQGDSESKSNVNHRQQAASDPRTNFHLSKVQPNDQPASRQHK